MPDDHEPANPGAAAVAADKLRRLPAPAADDFKLFCSNGDTQALGRLIIAVLIYHSPSKGSSVTAWTDDIRLIEDVGFDSLAVAETVFFFEDLFQITISNEEILHLRTIGELRAFVQMKARTASA